MATPIALQNIPEVRLLEDITRESATRLIEELSAYKGRPVALSIFSNGGDVHASNAIAKYISNPANDMRVEARVYGNAASGAMIICAACQKAYIASGSFALIHEAHAIGQDGKVIPVAELPKEEVAILEAMNADQVALFKKRTGKTDGAIEKLMEQDREMTAQQAVDFGLFDGIIPQALKLAAFKQIPMSDEKKFRAFKVKVARTLDNITALASGNEVEVQIPEEQIASADAAKVTDLETQIAAKTKELADLQAAKLEADNKVTTSEAAKKTAEDALAAKETELVASKGNETKYLAAIDVLQRNPLVAQVLPNGQSVVIPGELIGADPTKGMTKKEAHLVKAQATWEAAKKQAWGKPATA